MESKEIAIVVGIALAVAVIVAVIASAVTVNLVGNTIKVATVTNGTDVYTKNEIDFKFLNITAVSCYGDPICEVFRISTPISAPTLLLTSSGKRVEVDGKLVVMGASNYLAAQNLSGVGNDYACIDQYGRIFRSATGC